MDQLLIRVTQFQSDNLHRVAKLSVLAGFWVLSLQNSRYNSNNIRVKLNTYHWVESCPQKSPGKHLLACCKLSWWYLEYRRQFWCGLLQTLPPPRTSWTFPWWKQSFCRSWEGNRLASVSSSRLSIGCSQLWSRSQQFETQPKSIKERFLIWEVL